MPIATADVTLVEALKKAQHSADPSKAIEILDKLASVTSVEFIVNTEAGKVVKACRTNDSQEVKDKAVKLTATWKALVAATLKETTGKDHVPVKRKFADGGEDDGSPKSKKQASSPAAGGGVLAVPRVGEVKVLQDRVRKLSGSLKVGGKVPEGKHVLYWMCRDQRVQDNWALLYAQQMAQAAGCAVAVCFNLEEEGDGVAGRRQYAFQLRGLAEVDAELKSLNIPMYLLRGSAGDTVPKLAKDSDVGLIVVDYNPLRKPRADRDRVGESLPAGASLHEVDAHNVVPVWVASDKQEVMARTIRPKITNKLPRFLTPFPEAPGQGKGAAWPGPEPGVNDWEGALQSLKLDDSVPEVDWAVPGYKGGMANLDAFFAERLRKFATHRNDPNVEACSYMSPWINHGQVSAARCMLEAKTLSKKHGESVASYVEEGVIRSELSDNFCHYNPRYDSLEGCAAWARETLETHASDKRSKVYTREQLERAKTHDDLWNAAQLQLVHTGRMHGFLRMYWAKKILEWTATPEHALADSIFFNDRYALDGRDSNGYVGCMWSIGGVHDMGWKERPTFGKIRYMNYEGCKRKFRIGDFVMKIQRVVSAIKKGAK